MGILLVVVSLVLAAGLLLWWSQASGGPLSNAVFEITVRDGKVDSTRGQVASAMLADLEDVLQKPLVEEGKIWAVKDPERGAIRIKSKGLSARQAQRVRNIAAIYPS